MRWTLISLQNTFEKAPPYIHASYLINPEKGINNRTALSSSCPLPRGSTPLPPHTSRLPPDRACMAIFRSARADMRTLQATQPCRESNKMSWGCQLTGHVHGLGNGHLNVPHLLLNLNWLADRWFSNTEACMLSTTFASSDP